ncbi:unnamed protein product [Cochlearia groenlandica]
MRPRLILKLPCELEEDILSRLPPKSLLLFKSVCKQWNSLFIEKRFVSIHSSRSLPQFIIMTKSKIHSINMIDLKTNDPTIESRELHSSDIILPRRDFEYTIVTCDELLFCRIAEKNTALWNPCSRQVKWLEFKNIRCFRVFGFGYDNSGPDKVYKVFGYFLRYKKIPGQLCERVALIYDCASHAFNYIDTTNDDEDYNTSDHRRSHVVSLNGNIYWLSSRREKSTNHECSIRSFDFSRQILKPFCKLLPCHRNVPNDGLVLACFKGDRFSLLKQCFVTRKIEIWVTEKTIQSINNDDDDDGKGVVWINLMTLQATILPNLSDRICGAHYFIYGEKTLIMCCGDHNNRNACIYVMRGDLFEKIPIDCVTDWFSQCVYVPSLI